MSHRAETVHLCPFCSYPAEEDREEVDIGVGVQIFVRGGRCERCGGWSMCSTCSVATPLDQPAIGAVIRPHQEFCPDRNKDWDPPKFGPSGLAIEEAPDPLVPSLIMFELYQVADFGGYRILARSVDLWPLDAALRAHEALANRARGLTPDKV